MTVQKTQRMELLSWHYVSALAASVGVQTTKPPVDNHSVDGTFVSSAGRNPKIDFQLKATYAHSFVNDSLSFPLQINNYNDLRRTDTFTPQILIVLVMPPLEAEWLSHGHDALLIRNCAYWKSLYSMPETLNSTSVTIEINKASSLSPNELQALLTKVESDLPL